MIVRIGVGVALAAALAIGSPSGAIVGGTAVPQGKYPFLASVQENGNHLCGGSVVARQWVLTAKHCLVGYDADSLDQLSVVVGAVDLRSGGTRVAAAEVRRHPDGNSDVALIRLVRTVTAVPISLPTGADDRYEADGVRLITAGWGSTLPVPINGTDEAQEVDVPAMSDANCAATTQAPPAADRYVCAGGEVLKDSCNGDSGGPLFAIAGTRRILLGTVSYGPIPCGTPTQPGVYAEVNNPGILSWIKVTINPPKRTARRR